MNILIAGDGKVGTTLAKKLVEEGHDLTLLDINQDVLDNTTERLDVMTMQGNAASMEVLDQAEAKKADLFIAVTGKDETNLLSCITAHALNPNLSTIARIRNPEYGRQLYEMRETLGLSLTVNPERQAAEEIERILKYPGFLKRDTFAKGKVEIVELLIDETSKLNNISLFHLPEIVECKVLVCAVTRNGQAIIPGGDFMLQAGDHVYVTAPATELTTLLKNLGILKHKAKTVLLCGGGHVSFYLAQLLTRNGINVQLIESNYQRCVELASQLPKVNVIHGDASNLYLLEQEGIYKTDAFVSMTGLDEMNMILSIFAKQCNVPQVITKVDHTENTSIQDSLPLGSVVCPKDLCCSTIVRFVRAMQNTTGAALTVHSIADGQAEALEFKVDDQTKHCGEPLKNIRIKKNVLIACITQGRNTIIANGDASFDVGNRIIVIASNSAPIHKINDIFEN